MVTKREFLISQGLIAPDRGPGRYPRAATDAIKAAEEKGMHFDEVVVKAKPENPKVVRNVKPVVVEVAPEPTKAEIKAKLMAQQYAPTAPPRPDRPKGQYTFRNPDGTTFRRLHTTACQRCGYSLQWCYCEVGPRLQTYPWRGGEFYATMHVVPARGVITTNDVPEKQPQQGTGAGTRRGRGRPRKAKVA